MLLYRLRNNKFKHYLRRRFKWHWRFINELPQKVSLFGVRTLSRIMPSLVTIDRDSLYPPNKSCSSTIDWISSSGVSIGATYREVDAPCSVLNSLPKTIHDGIRRQFSAEQVYSYPNTFVATIPFGRVWGDGFIVTPDNYLLNDVSIDFKDKNGYSSIFRDWRLSHITEYEGRVVVLSTDGGNIYYHWLFQLLPRFELVRRAGIDLSGVDYFVINGLNKSFQRESCEILGIDSTRIIQSCEVHHLRAKELIVPSIPLSGGCFRPWMCQFLKDTFLTGRDDGNLKSVGRRLYISRSLASYRRVLNENEVIKYLRLRGFEEITFERLSVQQQAATMAVAEVVVAPHGAGLSNLVFCAPGTKVIEIFSPELVIGFFWKLSNQLGLDYYYFLGKGRPATRESDYEQSWETLTDIEVDLDMLERALDLANIR